MAQQVQLTAELRSGTGRGAVRKLRAEGKLPAVLYGRGFDARPIAVPRAELIRTLQHHGFHPLVRLRLDGTEHLALVKDVQIDAVKNLAVHVDFHRVEADKPVSTEVAVHMEGTAAGVKLGGVMEQQLRTLSITALPLNIPEEIVFDVSEMGIGDSARVLDMTIPDGVTVVTDPEEVVVIVAAPRVEAGEAAAEGEEGAAPADREAAATEPAAEES